MRPVFIEMTGTDGVTLTLRSCCIPQWFRDGQPVHREDALAVIPKRRPRAGSKARFKAELAAALAADAA
jgi:hypothetical protein